MRCMLRVWSKFTGTRIRSLYLPSHILGIQGVPSSIYVPDTGYSDTCGVPSLCPGHQLSWYLRGSKFLSRTPAILILAGFQVYVPDTGYSDTCGVPSFCPGHRLFWYLWGSKFMSRTPAILILAGFQVSVPDTGYSDTCGVPSSSYVPDTCYPDTCRGFFSPYLNAGLVLQVQPRPLSTCFSFHTLII